MIRRSLIFDLLLPSPDCQGVLVALWSHICAFLNAYLAAKSSNQVAVIGCYGDRSQFLYCADYEHATSSAASASLNSTENDTVLITSAMLGNSSKPEAFNYMNICIRERLKRFSKTLTAKEIEASLQTSLAGALGKALCYARRLSQQQVQSSVKQTATTTHVLAAASGVGSSSRIKRSTRIVAISCGREKQDQYLHFINAVFTAQKMGIVMDALVLDTVKENNSIMLQQAADLTGGIYHKLNHLGETLSVLFAAFLVEPTIRNKVYVFRRFTAIDYRAACFCHHKLVDTGFVCSVCLSVFCTFRPICSTCSVHFNVWKNLKASQMSPAKSLPPANGKQATAEHAVNGGATKSNKRAKISSFI